MTDINKQIEENKYWRTFVKENRCWTPTTEAIGKLAFNNGYNKAKKELAHSSRWRKVSEEMPECSVDVLCKYDSGTLFIGYLSKVDNAFRVANTHYNVIREVISWKPID